MSEREFDGHCLMVAADSQERCGDCQRRDGYRYSREWGGPIPQAGTVVSWGKDDAFSATVEDMDFSEDGLVTLVLDLWFADEREAGAQGFRLVDKEAKP